MNPSNQSLIDSSPIISERSISRPYTVSDTMDLPRAAKVRYNDSQDRMFKIEW